MSYTRRRCHGSTLLTLDETDRGGLGTGTKAKEDMDDMDIDALAWRVAIVPCNGVRRTS
jgi:hypothetical protein